MFENLSLVFTSPLEQYPRSLFPSMSSAMIFHITGENECVHVCLFIELLCAYYSTYRMQTIALFYQ